MKITLSSIGKFHTFDLARELHNRGVLEAIATGYPRFKLGNERLPKEVVRTFPWINTPYLGFPRKDVLAVSIVQAIEYINKRSFDVWTSLFLPPSNVFVGLSGSSLLTGRAARRRGERYVCDRGSSHIRFQNHILKEEHALWNVPFGGVDPRVIALEEQEYEEADCITVPSSFNVRSFVSAGIPQKKIRRLPYGVDLKKFYPTASPALNAFDVLFVGGMQLRKGIPYLLQAFKRLQHPHKTLTFVGGTSPALIAKMQAIGLWSDQITVMGSVPQHHLKELMSKSHVMVLPSIEEGLALVQAQAMACACPVIASLHTGAEDLFDDQREGFIVPIRDSLAIADRLQQLADDPALREQMCGAALLRVQSLGGWRNYGDQAVEIYRSLIEDIKT